MELSLYPDCQLSFADGKATCSVCGRTYSAPNGKLRAQCKPFVASPPPPPSPQLARGTDDLTFLQKAKNFAIATAKHVASGMPTCTDEEIIRRHNICMGCEFFKNDSCSKCGCPVYRDKKFVSKLAWADQSCPVGKWGPVNSEKAKEGQ